MVNITTCSPPNARSWTTLSSIITPTRAIDAHCKIEIETGQTTGELSNEVLAEPNVYRMLMYAVQT